MTRKGDEAYEAQIEALAQAHPLMHAPLAKRLLLVTVLIALGSAGCVGVWLLPDNGDGWAKIFSSVMLAAILLPYTVLILAAPQWLARKITKSGTASPEELRRPTIIP